MIIKNLTRTTKNTTATLIKYLLKYALNKEKQGVLNEAEKPFVLRHNIKNKTISGYVTEFKENESRRVYKRKDQVVAHHTILSWNSLDAPYISHKTLRAVAKEYIKLRGANNLYIFAEHNDREHTHLHCCMSGTRLDGRSSSITKEQFATIKIKMEDFQRTNFPEILHSFPDHGRGKKQAISLGEPSILPKNVRPLQKDILSQALLHAYINSQSLNEFIESLRNQGFEPYYRNENKIMTGVKAGARKFRLRTLGYDTQKLAVLDDREKMQVGLTELQSIRTRNKVQEKNKEIENEYVREITMERENATDGEESASPFYSSFEGFGEFPERDVLQGA